MRDLGPNLILVLKNVLNSGKQTWFLGMKYPPLPLCSPCSPCRSTTPHLLLPSQQLEGAASFYSSHLLSPSQYREGPVSFYSSVPQSWMCLYCGHKTCTVVLYTSWNRVPQVSLHILYVGLQSLERYDYCKCLKPFSTYSWAEKRYFFLVLWILNQTILLEWRKMTLRWINNLSYNTQTYPETYFSEFYKFFM